MEKPKNIVHEHCKELMRLFLTPGIKPNFGKEIKTAKILLSKYPIEFWRQYQSPSYTNSLIVFLTGQLKKELDADFDMWKFTKPKEAVKLQENPVFDLGQLDIPKNKPSNLLEFIDNI